MVSEVVAIDRTRRSLVFFAGAVEPAPLHWGRLIPMTTPIVLLGIASFIFAVGADERWRPFALSLLLIFVGTKLLLFMALRLNQRIAWNGLRVRGGEELTLVGKGFGGVYSFAAGHCFIASAVLTIWSHSTPGVAVTSSTRSVGWAILTLLLGLVCVIATSIKLLRPSHIHVEEHGVTIRQGIRDHHVPWPEIASISLRASGKQNATVELERREKSSFLCLRSNWVRTPASWPSSWPSISGIRSIERS